MFAVKKPDTTHDEQYRLRTLRSLNALNSPPEDRFDRLTRMAMRIFGVPMAVVSLVDENVLWLKSCIGLGFNEAPRDTSFCGHAILGSEIFVVHDATKDERFADNPSVLNEPNIRFYAGCPLNVKGTMIGTLCIIDRIPRNFSKEDGELLKDLAGMVEMELTAVQLATLDDLTDISNRRGLMAVANKILPLCVRKSIPATLAIFDLNNFKSINDEFGHAEGDKALISFAEQLSSTFRAADAVARIGGDEFVVLLTGTSNAYAEGKVEKFRASLEKNNMDASRRYDISFSYGLVELEPEIHHSIEDLLIQADSLMYQRKQQRQQPLIVAFD